MTESTSSETPEVDGASRRERLAARRRKQARIVALVLAGAVICGAAGAFAVYAVKNTGSSAQAAPGQPVDATFGKGGTIPTAGAASTRAIRTLTHAAPLRLWVGGDSLAGSFGPALGDLVGATGVAQSTVDYKVSSGLWGDDVRNWTARATDQMATANPEAVVFIIGTNDWPVVNTSDANGDGIEDWTVGYRAKVDRMMDTFIGPNHRTVFWLGAPTLGTQSWDRGVKGVNAVMREEAQKRPDVVYVDTYKLFSSPDGTYSRHILDENGNDISARITDGVHFSADGAAYLARAVFSLIDAHWHLLKQADSGEPIGWTLANGSGENVPGYSQRPTSRYHGRSNQSQYTPQTNPPVYTPPTVGATTPATAPPATAPPATSPPVVTTPVTKPHTTPTTS